MATTRSRTRGPRDRRAKSGTRAQSLSREADRDDRGANASGGAYEKGQSNMRERSAAEEQPYRRETERDVGRADWADETERDSADRIATRSEYESSQRHHSHGDVRPNEKSRDDKTRGGGTKRPRVNRS